MHRIAIYDLDRTITRAPTWTPFLLASARVAAPWRLLLTPLAALAMLAHVAGLVDRARLKQAMHRLMLGGRLAPDAVHRLAERFAERIVATGVPATARARMAADRREGYTLVLATAAYRFYAEAIARRLGFDAVIATASAFDAGGYLLAHTEGENCYGPAKLAMVQGWLAERGIARADAHVRAYTDHVSDAPLLDWADAPVAVNAHRRLRRLARTRGWPLVKWR